MTARVLPGEPCRFCASVLVPRDHGCAANHLKLRRAGATHVLHRIPHHGHESCSECGVPAHSCHHEGCPFDECPYCKQPLLSCGCEILSSGYVADVGLSDFAVTI